MEISGQKQECFGESLNQRKQIPRILLRFLNISKAHPKIHIRTDRYPFPNDRKLIITEGATCQSNSKQPLEKLIYKISDDKAMEDLKEIVEDVKIYLTHLQGLYVKFPVNHLSMTDKSLKIIGELIGRNLVHLQKMALTFNQCTNMTDNGLKILATEISRYSVGLKELKLCFREPEKLTDRGVKDMSRQICRNLIHLKKLELTLDGKSKISHRGAVLILNQIAKHLFNLRELSLGFICWEKLRFEKIETHNLTKLIHLQKLTLDFSKCYEIDDQGLEAIGKNILPYLTQLKQFSMDLYHCPRISDQGLEVIAKSIETYLVHLTTLTLYFNYCYKISNQGIEAITKIILHLSKLQKFTLNFARCGKVSSSVFEAINNRLMDCQTDLQNLQKFKLFISENIYVPEAVERLKQNLSYIPSVEVNIDKKTCTEFVRNIFLHK